jgi:hypothetical protein
MNVWTSEVVFGGSNRKPAKNPLQGREGPTHRSLRCVAPGCNHRDRPPAEFTDARLVSAALTSERGTRQMIAEVGPGRSVVAVARWSGLPLTLNNTLHPMCKPTPAGGLACGMPRLLPFARSSPGNVLLRSCLEGTPRRHSLFSTPPRRCRP